MMRSRSGRRQRVVALDAVLRQAVDRVVDEAAVDPQRGDAPRLGLLERLHDPALALGLLVGERGVGALHRLDLRRVDGHAALEAEPARAPAVGLEALVVLRRSQGPSTGAARPAARAATTRRERA